MKFIDLFAGIGGFRVALEELGHECVLTSEIDEFAKKTYEDNFGKGEFYDIKQINKNNLPSYDILVGGFPCQPFSIAGKKMGFKDPENGFLFNEILRIININPPKRILLENVPNLKTLNNGNVLKYIVKSLKNLGYKRVEFKILSGSLLGGVQSRKRLFIQATNFKIVWPKENISNCTVQHMIQGLSHPSNIFKDFNRAITWTKQEDTKYFKSPQKLGYYSKGRQGERIYSTHGKAITISASGGGMGGSTGLYKTDEGVRQLTIEEAKIIQGFPLNFNFKNASRRQALKQIGNAVDVFTIRKIIEEW